jgi:hypothetical protein
MWDYTHGWILGWTYFMNLCLEYLLDLYSQLVYDLA